MHLHCLRLDIVAKDSSRIYECGPSLSDVMCSLGNCYSHHGVWSIAARGSCSIVAAPMTLEPPRPGVASGLAAAPYVPLRLCCLSPHDLVAVAEKLARGVEESCPGLGVVARLG